MVFDVRSATASREASRLKRTTAAPPAPALNVRVHAGTAVKCPSVLIRNPVSVLLAPLSAYSTPSDTARLIGRTPPDATVAMNVRTFLSTANEAIVLLPAFTANRN